MRLIEREVRKPHFIGEIADAVTEAVNTNSETTRAVSLRQQHRTECAKRCTGMRLPVVYHKGRRTFHTGPFPVQGYDVIETVLILENDGNGAVRTVRRSHKKN